MINFVVKYVNLILIVFLLLIPIKPRAKVLWFLFNVKQYVQNVIKNKGLVYGK